ncbi:hypothetical protein MJ699_20655 [Klebsiella pneumoniae]|nr:hypothetical protein MJ699_20655 [Klebsiella pneumoniae]
MAVEFAVRYHRRHCLRLKLAFMGWGLGIRELDYGFSGRSALSAAFWLSSCVLGARSPSVCVKRPLYRLCSGRRGGLFAAGHPCAFRLGSDCRPAAGRCWQRCSGVAKRTSDQT